MSFVHVAFFSVALSFTSKVPVLVHWNYIGVHSTSKWTSKLSLKRYIKCCRRALSNHRCYKQVFIPTSFHKMDRSAISRPAIYIFLIFLCLISREFNFAILATTDRRIAKFSKVSRKQNLARFTHPTLITQSKFRIIKFMVNLQTKLC